MAGPKKQLRKPDIREIPIGHIIRDPEVQPRVSLNAALIDEYAKEIAEGRQFPPPVVFQEKENPLGYWAGDGFHRIGAHERLKRTDVTCEVRTGGRREAMLYACGVNAAHGLRRTNADKRRAVLRVLLDKQWSRYSGRRVAELCVVSNTFVSQLRADLKAQSVNVDTPRPNTALAPEERHQGPSPSIEPLPGNSEISQEDGSAPVVSMKTAEPGPPTLELPKITEAERTKAVERIEELNRLLNRVPEVSTLAVQQLPVLRDLASRTADMFERIEAARDVAIKRNQAPDNWRPDARLLA
jgi:hypothetical protein